MKQVTLRNENAAARFIRSYMAAHEVADLNLAKLGQTEWEVNHGHGRRVADLDRSLCHLPLDLTGDKPRQPQGRLTFQPFAALSKIQAATDSGWVGVEETKAFFEARGVNYPK